MVRRYYDLPSLTTLAVFEASARHLSFKLAASELNVTPSAVSRQIKALEEELGVALFVRLGSGVVLTSSGEDLYAVLASGFSKASQVARTLRRGDRSRNVTIACTYTFASMWLVQRMPRFWAKNEDVTVDHLISENFLDFRRAEVDLRIRCGSGSWPDETAEFLFDDRIYPICSPRFAQEHRDATAESLLELPLLHDDWSYTGWTGWDEVFRRAGIPHGVLRGRRFSKYFVTLQAAQADYGVAVGWHRLVRPLIEEGKLVKITDLELLGPGGGWYITWNDNRSLSPAAELLREWLREMAAEERSA